MSMEANTGENRDMSTISPTVDRAEAAAIIGCTANNVDNYAKQGLLVNVGGAGRYARPRFLRKQCEALRDRRPRRGRPTGIPNPRGGRRKKDGTGRI